MSSRTLPLPASDLTAQMRPALVQYFRRKCGSTAEAEDLAHDVLVSALHHANWTSLEQAKGYIFRSAVNRWRDRGRRRLTQGGVLPWNDDAPYSTDEGNSSERVVAGREEMAAVIQALNELPERTREVFVLQRLEQMTYPQIAEGLGMALSTVEKHMIRALAHLTARKRAQEGG